MAPSRDTARFSNHAVSERLRRCDTDNCPSELLYCRTICKFKDCRGDVAPGCRCFAGKPVFL